MEEKNMEIDVLKMIHTILNRKWLIVYITLISTMISVIISFFFIKPVYESTVSIVIGKESARMFYEDKYTNSDISMYQKLVKTYAEIALSNTVIQKTADCFDNYTSKHIKKLVSAVPKSDTQILELKVKNHIPSNTAKIANQYAENFILQSNKVLPAGELNILDKAELPYEPISPNTKLNISIAFILGLMLSIFIIFFLEYIDTKIRTEEQVTQYLGLPVLISIPNFELNS